MSFSRNFDWFLVDDNAAPQWPSGAGQNTAAEATSLAQSGAAVQLHSITQLTSGQALTIRHGDGSTAYWTINGSVEDLDIVLVDGLSGILGGAGAVYMISYLVLRAQLPASVTSRASYRSQG